MLTALPPACGSTPCLPGGVLPPHVILTPHRNHSIINNTKDNWQSRLGLTYRLRPNTVIRASAGRFFDNWAGVQQLAINYRGTWPDVAFNVAVLLDHAEDPVNARLDELKPSASERSISHAKTSSHVGGS